jgi:maltooligosyltrehalose trehalohydrolase
VVIENGLAPRLSDGGPALGATPLLDGGTRFVVWAPLARRVQVRLMDGGRLVDLEPLEEGYYAGVAEDCPPGSLYRYRLDGGDELADPASRHQPEGVLGPSAVVDLAAHRWADDGYRPRPLWEHVISEVHIGTLSAGGTFDSACEVLEGLVDVGISALEVMPVAEFPGSRNWGYDGVFPFSVQSTYGGPAGLQRLIDACHERGLAVILDVVHNHIGPLGNVLASFGPYFTDRYRTPWGPALNFDGADSDHVRAYFLESVVQWFVDYHVDALRLDAIHAILDTTATPFLVELSELAAHLSERLGRPCTLIAESGDNDPRVVTARSSGGIGMDAQWNDDYHHALHVALTSEQIAYYADYGRVEDLARAINDGFVLQGEYSLYRRRRHGAPSGSIDPERFVLFAQNHDQVGNRPKGERLSTLVPFDAQRLAAGLLLLSPGIPLLFMGDEYGETAPFPYFVDHLDAELNAAVHEGRTKTLRSMGFDEEPMDEAAEATFKTAVLGPSLREAPGHRELLALHRGLVSLREAHPALARSRRVDVSASVHGSVLTLTRRDPAGSAVSLFNVGAAPSVALAPSLVAGAGPASGTRWHRLFDSADPALGGRGPHQPAEADPGDSLSLAPWGFCVYASAPARPGGEP